MKSPLVLTIKNKRYEVPTLVSGPFTDNIDLEDLDKGRFERPLIAPSKLNVNVDENLDALVYRCLALNPKERFQNAMELKEALNQWVPGKRKRKYKNISAAQFSDYPKATLSAQSKLDKDMGCSMVEEALKMSKYVEKLDEAADLMEEAFNKWPKLIDKYAFKVTLWRKGV